MSVADADDAQLVSAALGGEAWAFATIMARNNQRLYRVAYTILRDDADAEDAMQEAYLNAFDNLDAFRGAASLATWLTRIVVNEAIGRLRHRRLRARFAAAVEALSAEAGGAPFLPAGAEDPERQAAREEASRILRQAIARLPTAFQDVFVLRALKQWSVGETADHLGIAVATVRTRYNRAKRLLGENLGREFGILLRDRFPFGGDRCRQLTNQVLERLIDAVRIPVDVFAVVVLAHTVLMFAAG